MDQKEREKIAFKTLWEIMDAGNFPTVDAKDFPSTKHIYGETFFEEHHLLRINGYSFNGNIATFEIDRHPSFIIGSSRSGMPESAFIAVTYIFEMDLDEKTVKVINVIEDDPVINHSMIADEDVNIMREGEWYTCDDLLRYNSESEVKKFAQKEIQDAIREKRFGWDLYYKYMASGEIPADFMSKYLPFFEKEFESYLVREWNYCVEEF
jgi:hypothetical protein